MIERSKRIELRVTAEELRQIHERMQETGISSLTAYMIRMLSVLTHMSEKLFEINSFIDEAEERINDIKEENCYG